MCLQPQPSQDNLALVRRLEIGDGVRYAQVVEQWPGWPSERFVHELGVVAVGYGIDGETQQLVPNPETLVAAKRSALGDDFRIPVDEVDFAGASIGFVTMTFARLATESQLSFHFREAS